MLSNEQNKEKEEKVWQLLCEAANFLNIMAKEITITVPQGVYRFRRAEQVIGEKAKNIAPNFKVTPKHNKVSTMPTISEFMAKYTERDLQDFVRRNKLFIHNDTFIKRT